MLDSTIGEPNRNTHTSMYCFEFRSSRFLAILSIEVANRKNRAGDFLYNLAFIGMTATSDISEITRFFSSQIRSCSGLLLATPNICIVNSHWLFTVSL